MPMYIAVVLSLSMKPLLGETISLFLVFGHLQSFHPSSIMFPEPQVDSCDADLSIEDGVPKHLLISALCPVMES